MAKGFAQGFSQGFSEGFAEGRAEGLLLSKRKTVLIVGVKYFGEPSIDITASLNAITDTARLDRMLLRVPDVKGWDELLETE